MSDLDRFEDRFQAGDRIRVKEPPAGEAYHRFSGQTYNHETWVGRFGIIEEIHAGKNSYAAIEWEPDRRTAKERENGPRGRPTSCIDLDCLEQEDSRIDQEVADLFGLNPPKHCSTCQCSPLERARKDS